MEAKINTQHPQHIYYSPRWTVMTDCLLDDMHIKSKGTEYLKKTGGMLVNDKANLRYDSYKYRAQFPEITSQALTSMVGLIFEKDPLGESEDIISNAGQANKAFARDVVRAVASKGRDILVVDAPKEASGGGEPFIARYNAEALINWKTIPGKPSEFMLAVLKETPLADPDDLYSHETKETFRQYLNTGSGIEVSVWEIEDDVQVLLEEPIRLPVSFMPVIAVGSIDSVPDCDPIPLLPVANHALRYYSMSADYGQALHLHGNPTPWVKGITPEQYDLILAQGIGTGSLWYVGEGAEGSTGFLSIDQALQEPREAMQEQLKLAESYAVRVTQQSDAPESGIAISKRAAAQHASIYTIADSVSIAVTEAQRMRAIWAGQPEPEDFKLDAKIEDEYAGEQMIQALDSAINSLNAPQSAMFEAIRKAGLSELTDEQMRAEIETTGGLNLAVDDEPVNAPG